MTTPQDLVPFQAQLASVYCVLAATVMLSYDVILTFDKELERIWKKRSNVVMVFFTLNRYFSIVAGIVTLVGLLSPPTRTSCEATSYAGDTATILVILAAAGFTSLRIFAIYDKSWLPALPILLVMLFPSIAVLHSAAVSRFDSIIDLLVPYGGCKWTSSISSSQQLRWETAVDSAFVAGQSLILIATWSKSYRIKREAGELGIDISLTNLLLQDGTVYFFIFWAIKVFQLIIDQSRPGPFLALVSYFTGPLISVSMSHFLLDLHVTHDPPSEGEVLKSIVNHSRLGNIGAPLVYTVAGADGEELGNASDLLTFWSQRNASLP